MFYDSHSPIIYHRGNPSLNSQGQWTPACSPGPAPASMKPYMNNPNIFTEKGKFPTITVVEMSRMDGLPDNCCEQGPRPPTPEPDADLPDNTIRYDLPEDNVTVIVIQGFCDPSACTTQAGPAGPQGEKGDWGEAGATGPQGEKGEKGDPGNMEDFDIILELTFLDSNSTEPSSFTKTRESNIFKLLLKLKMDSELARKIYEILGGDEWFQAGTTPSLQINPQAEIETYEAAAKNIQSVIV